MAYDVSAWYTGSKAQLHQLAIKLKDASAVSDRLGRTPLKAAIEADAVEAARVLLDHNAKLDGAVIDAGVFGENYLVLHYVVPTVACCDVCKPALGCVCAGRDDILDLLARAGVPVAKETDAAGATALHRAADAGHASTVRKLIGFGCDPNARDKCMRMCSLPRVTQCDLIMPQQ
jgi:ankyrin repeat protein